MKARVDALLVERDLCESREQAKRLILAGEVFSGTLRIAKPAMKISVEAPLMVREKPKFVSRGGFKLEGALEHFQIDPRSWVCLDCGSSTGGFTDCLLQLGAVKIHAVDVGTNQLVWKLRNDPRVVVKERFNARYMTQEDIGECVDLCVTDVSFISLTKILPALFAVLKEGGQIVCLIKPQFELERKDIGKGGIVRDEQLHKKAVDKIHRFVTEDLKKVWLGVTHSSIKGTDGNIEFLACLKNNDI